LAGITTFGLYPRMRATPYNTTRLRRMDSPSIGISLQTEANPRVGGGGGGWPPLNFLKTI